MLWTIALPIVAAGPICPVSLQSIPIVVTPVPGAMIGGRPDPTEPGSRRIGPFTYRGHGIVGRSADPQFAALILDQRFGLRHRCGNPVSGPSGWNADDPNLAARTLEIEPIRVLSEGSPGATEADRRGARPVLKGYRAGPSWPVHYAAGRFFIGLMHPPAARGETRIVAFRGEPRATPAVTLATIPMRLQTIGVVPGLHEPASYLNLESLRDGAWARIVLRIDDAATGTIAEALARQSVGKAGWSG